MVSWLDKSEFDKETYVMKKICVKCDKEFDESMKKCPICDNKLKSVFTEQELEEIKKQNDDMVAINTMMPL